MAQDLGESQGQLPEEVNEFLVESHENLDRLDRDLVALEADPMDKERLSSIFRTIHTIKGTCGFLGFQKLESVTHVGENLLSKLRDGELILNPAITDALLAMVDAVREMLARIESTASDGEVTYLELIARLTEAAAGSLSGCVAVAPVLAAAPADEPTKVEPVVGNPSQSEALAPLVVVPPVVATPDLASKVAAADAAKEPIEAKSVISDSSVRVDVGLLDRLMNLVGELVLARNQILQHTAGEANSALVATTQRLNLITSELQEGVMKTRMQPIGTIWSKFPRVVRDLSQSLSKHVRLELEGKETELDRTIIEAIKDPLTHLVRNSVDHGIEMPEIRSANSKPDEGILTLSAYHEGGYVNIEVIDDGAGIDPLKLKAKAIEKGLITVEQASKMSDREVQHLIFMPGFSTAEKVTNVSGRGVGMDVVKTNIERIGGSIEVNSELGKGSTFKIRIPLTLAIIPALIIKSAGERFAIPQVSLVELVRLEAEQAKVDIDAVDGAPVCRLRGHLLPLVKLSEVLKLESELVEDEGATNIVVLQADHRQFGLVVDHVVDTEEIVVKPLGKQIKSVNTFAGATIMGDGRVALILDVMGVAKAGHVVSESLDSRSGSVSESRGDYVADKEALLLLGLGHSARVAVPLASVDRLEEFETDSLEWAGSQPVVQYRNGIMPLLWLASALGVDAGDASDSKLQVVVHSSLGRSVGIVVGSILDITEEQVTLDPYGSRDAIRGSAVIQGKVTDVVDLTPLVEAVVGELVGVGVIE